MKAWYEWREAPSASFAVIGDPIEHSWSPLIHTAALSTAGPEHRYVAIRVPKDELAPALYHLTELGYLGVNVTVPLKESAYRLSDPDDVAQRYGTVNTIRLGDRTSTNTDAGGFRDSLQGLIESPSHALVLGAGGTSKALCRVLAEDGWRILIWNRTRERGESLLADLGFQARLVDSADPTGAGLILNTTSASLQGAALPVLWERASHTALAYDVSYGVEPSRFLQDARRSGLNVLDGVDMLIGQAARSLSWWLGIEPDRKAMADALEHLRWKP